MSRTIALKYAGTCKDCGATLPAGTRARYYGRGRIYGTECHPQRATRRTREEVARAELHDSRLSWQTHGNRHADAQYLSKLDPTGFYNSAGECIGRVNPAGRCEDAPCCGCCS